MLLSIFFTVQYYCTQFVVFASQILSPHAVFEVVKRWVSFVLVSHRHYSLPRHFLLWGSSFYWPLSHYPVVGSRIQCSMILLIPIVSLFCFLRIRDNEHMFFHVWLGSYAFEISNCWCLWCFVIFLKITQKNEQESKRKATQEQEHNDDEEEEEPQTQSHRFVPSI